MSTVVNFGLWRIGGDPETTARRSGPAGAPALAAARRGVVASRGFRLAVLPRAELANERSQAPRGGRLSTTCTGSKQPRFISFLRNGPLDTARLSSFDLALHARSRQRTRR